MLSCLEQALAGGYGVIVLNPNANSVTLTAEQAAAADAALAAGAADAAASAAATTVDASAPGRPRKVAIEDSRSPEEHALGVWQNLVVDGAYGGEVYLLSFGNGCSLAKDVVLRNLSSVSAPPNVVAVATVEASGLVENDDPADVKAFMAAKFVNWEQSEVAVFGARILAGPGAELSRYGCSCLSVGCQGEEEMRTAAWSVGKALDGAFRYVCMHATRNHVTMMMIMMMIIIRALLLLLLLLLL